MVHFIGELREVWLRQRKNWRTVVIRNIFNRFFNEITLQYANIYITLLGATPIQLGAVSSTLGLAQALISPPLGIIRDRYNIRKIYLVGTALLITVPLIYALASDWRLIVLAILISGLGMMIGSCVIICDLSLPTQDRATGKALCESIGALPTILAPTVAAVILTYLGGITVQGVRGLYWIQFVARVILFIYVYRNLTDIDREPRASEKGTLLTDFKEVFQRGIAVNRWLLFVALNMFTMSMLTTFRYNYAFEIKGATQFILGGFATAMLVTETVFSTIIGRIADKIGRKRAFYILTPLFSLANLVLIYAHNQYWLIVSGLLMGFRMIAGFSYGSMTPELVPSDCLGRWRGLVGLVTGLASIVAPVVGGLIWEYFGPEWIFIVIILIDILIRLPLLYSVPETLKNARAHQLP